MWPRECLQHFHPDHPFARAYQKYVGQATRRLIADGPSDTITTYIRPIIGHRVKHVHPIKNRLLSDVTDGPEKGWRAILIHGKGEKVREVHVRPEVWDFVFAYLQRRKDELTDASPLFASVQRPRSIRPQAEDLRIPPATIYKRFKKYVRKSGLPAWASPHCMRHFFAAESHENGASAEAIRRALGHSSLKTTQRYLDRLTSGVNEAFVRVKAL